MSENRRVRRAKQRFVQTIMAVLSDRLGKFYTFLEKSPKPSDEEVRSEFIRQEENWKRYCGANRLPEEVFVLFNQEVAISWKERYTIPNESPKKLTQQQ